MFVKETKLNGLIQYKPIYFLHDNKGPQINSSILNPFVVSLDFIAVEFCEKSQKVIVDI